MGLKSSFDKVMAVATDLITLPLRQGLETYFYHRDGGIDRQPLPPLQSTLNVAAEQAISTLAALPMIAVAPLAFPGPVGITLALGSAFAVNVGMTVLNVEDSGSFKKFPNLKAVEARNGAPSVHI